MHPLTIHGLVESGEGLARRLGCPTANLAPEEGQVIPGMAVYLGFATVDGASYPSIVCVNDSRDQHRLKIEVHLIDQDMELNGKRLSVELRERMRDLVEWPGEEEMCRMIKGDLAQARAYFASIQPRP